MMKKLLWSVVLYLGLFTTVNAQFTTMGIRGSATSVGWDGPNDIMMETTDGVEYTLSKVSLIGGGLKFRQNNEWPNNWGGTTFPSGVGIFDQGGVDVPVVAGVYDVTFNMTTLAYNFTYLYPMMGMRGAATTVGWDGPVDIFMNTTDGVVYNANAVTLTAGGLKFRRNNEWPNNWGGATWPSGVGIFDQGGVDIPAEAGTYDVTFNSSTLAYDFVTSGLGITKNQMASIKIYPNPTHDIVMFDAGENVMDKIEITDMLGKIVLSKQFHASELSVDISALASGLYSTIIYSGKTVKTVKLLKY